jgi:hypothetical protein
VYCAATVQERTGNDSHSQKHLSIGPSRSGNHDSPRSLDQNGEPERTRAFAMMFRISAGVSRHIDRNQLGKAFGTL